MRLWQHTVASTFPFTFCNVTPYVPVLTEKNDTSVRKWGRADRPLKNLNGKGAQKASTRRLAGTVSGQTRRTGRQDAPPWGAPMATIPLPRKARNVAQKKVRQTDLSDPSIAHHGAMEHSYRTRGKGENLFIKTRDFQMSSFRLSPMFTA